MERNVPLKLYAKKYLSRATARDTFSAIKARSMGLLRACCYFEFPVVVKGAKNFAGVASQIFSTQFLDKTKCGKQPTIFLRGAVIGRVGGGYL